MAKLTRRVATVELADGRVLTARITNPDTLRYEQEAHRNGWPGMTIVDGVTSMGDLTRRTTFEAWAALKRTNQYAGTWATFSTTDCVDIATDEEDVNPTPPGPDSGSLPNSRGPGAEVSSSSVAQMTNS